MTLKDLEAAVRRVPGFPKPGITFYDITSVLADPDAFSFCIDELAQSVSDTRADAIAAIEARGFVFAAPLAHRLRLPLLLARKQGKLPNACRCQGFSLEYGTDTICIQEVDLVRGRRVHIIDDLLATGGTAYATAKILESAGSEVCGVSGIIGLPFLGYPEILRPRNIKVLVEFHSE